MPSGLYFDGDLRRIYEVPQGGSFTTDGDGFRTYWPGPSPDLIVTISHTDLWSRFVEYRQENEWSSVAFSKSGGAFRFNDSQGTPIFATFDLRLINNWELVPANYPHSWTIDGNVFPNEAGRDFDTAMLTSQGVSPRIRFSDSLQVVQQGDDDVAGAGLLIDERAALFAILREVSAGERHLVSGLIQRFDGEGVIREFDREGGAPLPADLTITPR